MKKGEKVGAILLAAGASQRMEGVDKAFAPLLGRPLVSYPLQALEASPLVDGILLVLSEGNWTQGQVLLGELGLKKMVGAVLGGERRQDSVHRGVEAMEGFPWLLVHDGARPLLEGDLIARALEAAEETGAAVPVVPATDTVKRVGAQGYVLETLPREALFCIQTPQACRRDLLIEAYQRIPEDAPDDAFLVERLGHPVKVFPGSPTNIKVTYPHDLAVAEALLRGGRWGMGQGSGAKGHGSSLMA